MLNCGIENNYKRNSDEQAWKSLLFLFTDKFLFRPKSNILEVNID